MSFESKIENLILENKDFERLAPLALLESRSQIKSLIHQHLEKISKGVFFQLQKDNVLRLFENDDFIIELQKKVTSNSHGMRTIKSIPSDVAMMPLDGTLSYSLYGKHDRSDFLSFLNQVHLSPGSTQVFQKGTISRMEILEKDLFVLVIISKQDLHPYVLQYDSKTFRMDRKISTDLTESRLQIWSGFAFKNTKKKNQGEYEAFIEMSRTPELKISLLKSYFKNMPVQCKAYLNELVAKKDQFSLYAKKILKNLETINV